MKYTIFLAFLLFLFYPFYGHAQCTNNDPVQDARDMKISINNAVHIITENNGNTTTYVSVQLSICKDYSLHNQVRFLVHCPAGAKYNLNFGDGSPVTSIQNGSEVIHDYPLNSSGSNVNYTVSVTWTNPNLSQYINPVLINHGDHKITMKTSSSYNNGGYVPPDDIWEINVSGTFEPPVGGAFPNGSPFNNNTISGAHAYIKYAPAHGGKLLKPLIFVDGIDFNSKVYTYNGEVIRHGSTGWDVITMGNDASEPNPVDGSASEFSFYPSAFHTLTSEPNNYDIIFLDFASGADWIEKNGLALVELIQRVNAKKQADADDEHPACGNGIIGASMGGQVAKWALTFMEQNNLNHQCHTYISFDSPHKGAHIPIGLQSMVYLTGRLDADQIGQWNDLNTPGARQMLIETLEGGLAGNRLSTTLIERDQCNNTDVDMPLNIDFSSSNEIRSSFEATMSGAGYPKQTRNVAISCGSIAGKEVEGNAYFRARYFANPPNIACGLEGNVVSVESIGFDGGNLSLYPLLSFSESWLGWGCCTAGIPAEPNSLFLAAIPTENVHWALVSDDPPKKHAIMRVKSEIDYPALDHAPGCKRGDLLTIENEIRKASEDITIDANDRYTTFMPTLSLLDIQWPMDDEHLYKPIPADAVQTGLTPFDAIYGPDENLRHVELTAGMLNFAIEQLELGRQKAASDLILNPNQTYNFGNAINNVPNTIINNKATLAVNLTGTTNYMTPNDPPSIHDVFEVYMGNECGKAEEVLVKNGGKLLIGDPNNGGKAGIFHLYTGGTIHVEAGGTLRISNNSSLIIYKNAKLILEPGAIVELFDQTTGALVEYARPRIYVKKGGKVVFNGNIQFSGDGFFDIDEGHLISFPSYFSFNGSGANYRHFRLNKNAVLLKNGGTLNFNNAKVQVGCGAKLSITNFDNLFVRYCKFEDLNNAQCNNSGLSSQIAIEAINGRKIFINNSEFKNVRKGIYTDQIADFLRVGACKFENEIGVDAHRTKYAALGTVQGNKASFNFDLCATGVSLTNCNLLGAFPTAGEVVSLLDVKLLTMTGGLIDALQDVNGITALLGENNIYMQKGATIQNGVYGIDIKGGLPGHQYISDFGLVRMDCSRILDCLLAGIHGEDVLLDIDAGVNSNGLRPNEFRIVDANGFGFFFDICYKFRNPSQILANHNFWNRFNAAGVPAGPNPSDFVLAKLPNCSTAVPLVTTFIAPAYDATCPYRGGGGTSGGGGIPRDEQLVYRDCNLQDGSLYRNSSSTWTLLDDAWAASDLTETAPDMTAPLAGFATIANRTNTNMPCVQYINVARTFVLGGGDSQQHSRPIQEGANQSTQLEVYPNPTIDGAYVNINGGGTLKVRDQLGRLMLEISQSNDVQFIDTKNWPSGVYTIEAICGSKQELRTAKLVVHKK